MCDAVCLLTAERVGTTVCKCDDVCLLITRRVGLRCVSVTLFSCWQRKGWDYGVYVWGRLPVDSGHGGTTVCKCDDVCLLTAERVGLQCVCVTLFACWQQRGWDCGVYVWRCLPIDSGEGGTTVCKCDALRLLTAETIELRCVCVTLFACWQRRGWPHGVYDDVCLLIAKRVGLRCVSVTTFACWQRRRWDYDGSIQLER